MIIPDDFFEAIFSVFEGWILKALAIGVVLLLVGYAIGHFAHC